MLHWRMAATQNLLGSAASGVVNLLLYGAIIALWPRPEAAFAAAETEPWVSIDIWRPFIDNPGAGAKPSEREAECPAPQAQDAAYVLAAAPLPDGWNPHGEREGALYACVLVAGEGTVREARMLAGTGRSPLERELVETIRRSWRFRLVAHQPQPPSWQRVRLDAGERNGIVWDPPVLE
jgi:hypothetical protein